MSRLVSASLFLVTALLPACAPNFPPDYSPEYSYVEVESSHHPGRVHKVLVPDACVTPDPTAAIVNGPLLPPGCANAYNLQRMAEREHDLVKGRKLGRAPAAPSARAAEKYLNGAEQGPLGASAAGTQPAGSPSTPQEEEVQPSGKK
jgi:hypothetical protein